MEANTVKPAGSTALVTVRSVLTGLPCRLVWVWTVAAVKMAAITGFALTLVLFPDARFRPRWTRWLAITMIAGQIRSWA